MHTRVSPDPKHVKWISSTIAPGEEHDIVVTVAEGGDLFAIDRDNGDFLWARPFPYDDPNMNMNDIDLKTGATHINLRQGDEEGRRQPHHVLLQHQELVVHHLSSGKNALYVPYQDQCVSMGI